MEFSKGFKQWFILAFFLITIGGGLYVMSIHPQFPQPWLLAQKWLSSAEGAGQSALVKHLNQIEPNNTLNASRLNNLKHLDIQAGSMILMDADSGGIFVEKESNRALPAASMSKMMTELLVLEALEKGVIHWDSEVSISEYASMISRQPGLASVYLTSDQTYTVRELFEAMAIYSANGATIALAEAVAGDEKTFVKRMNETARHLHLKQSRFVNSTGLSNQDLGGFYSTGRASDTNIMSAKDVAVLAQTLLQRYPDLLEIVKQPKLEFRGRTYANTNWMLPEMHENHVSFQGVDGLKTGYTEEAGYCFAGTVKRGGMRLISVVMDTPSKTSRFSETGRLYAAVFQEDWVDHRMASVTEAR